MTLRKKIGRLTLITLFFASGTAMGENSCRIDQLRALVVGSESDFKNFDQTVRNAQDATAEKKMIPLAEKEAHEMKLITAAREVWDRQGVQYQNEDTYLIVQPVAGVSYANTLALRLKQTMNEKLVYEPSNSFGKAADTFRYNAGYREGFASKILISHESVKHLALGLPDSSIMHEVLHANFYRQRKADKSGILSGTAESTGEDFEHLKTAYRRGYSLEELATYSMNTRAYANDLKLASQLPADLRQVFAPTARFQLSWIVDRGLSLSRQTAALVRNGKDSLKLIKRGSEGWTQANIKSGAQSVTFPIPKEYWKSKASAEKYLHTQLERLQVASEKMIEQYEDLDALLKKPEIDLPKIDDASRKPITTVAPFFKGPN